MSLAKKQADREKELQPGEPALWIDVNGRLMRGTIKGHELENDGTRRVRITYRSNGKIWDCSPTIDRVTLDMEPRNFGDGYPSVSD